MLKSIERSVKADINDYIIKTYDEGFRNHLGASLIGHKCERFLWYIFRWTFRETFNNTENYARIMRLFNRGHREEDRFVEWLRGAGFEVWTHDKNGKQFRISGVNGHFGGSLDGVAKFPSQYGISEPVLLEFKTSGTGAGFNDTRDDGMMIAKPQHFAQTSTYGQSYNFRYVLYMIINKNDDSLHVELVKLNHNLGRQMHEKAERIITAQIPPAKLSLSPNFKECSYCPAKENCHQGKASLKNCRSCKFAKPASDGLWECGRYSALIPPDTIKTGCNLWEDIAK